MIFLPFLFVLFVAVVDPGFDESVYDSACVAKVEKTIRINGDSVVYMQDRMGKIEDNCPKIK